MSPRQRQLLVMLATTELLGPEQAHEVSFGDFRALRQMHSAGLLRLERVGKRQDMLFTCELTESGIQAVEEMP